MAIVYELTFFLGLGLLATITAIYVLSVTQIDKSSKLSLEQQQDLIKEQSDLATKEIERLQKQIDDARDIGRLDKAKLLSDLAESHAEQEIYEAGMKRLKERTQLLERTGAVVWPGSAFLTTIIFSVAAIPIIGINVIFSLALWIIGIFTLIFGIYRAFRTLGAIQEVTIASGDAIDRLPEAVKSALLDIEQSKKPELEITFTDEQPPLHGSPGQEFSINFSMYLTKGEVAKDISIFLACPPGFTFTNSPLCVPPHGDCYKEYSCILLKLDSLTFGVSTFYKIKVQAPATPGKFTCISLMSCEGFMTGWSPFDIVLE